MMEPAPRKLDVHSAKYVGFVDSEEAAAKTATHFHASCLVCSQVSHLFLPIYICS